LCLNVETCQTNSTVISQRTDPHCRRLTGAHTPKHTRSHLRLWPDRAAVTPEVTEYKLSRSNIGLPPPPPPTWLSLASILFHSFCIQYCINTESIQSFPKRINSHPTHFWHSLYNTLLLMLENYRLFYFPRWVTSAAEQFRTVGLFVSSV
jgi:hypothetical protein